jgi:hypothetical protein
MNRALVERIVDRARDWGYAARADAGRIEDYTSSSLRMAQLWERDARWWGVLLRYTDPHSPYYTAVLAAQRLSRDRAKNYRGYAASEARRVAKRAS